MATTIGTSTNLLVVSIARDLGLPRFGVFQFADIAVMAGLVALPYLWLVMPRLLPVQETDADHSSRRFDATLHVVGDSKIVGVSTQDLQRRLPPGMKITRVSRHGVNLPLETQHLVLPAGAEVEVNATLMQIRQAQSDLRAPLVPPTVLETLQEQGVQADRDQMVAELAVGADSNLIGQSVKSAQIADRYGVMVIGLSRPARAFFQPGRHSADERLAIGDVLLVQGAQSALRELQIREGGMILEGAAEMPRSAKATLALLIVAAVVLFAALRLVPIAIASLAGSITMIATGCVKFERIGRALSAEVIVLVAASIALGRAMLETGAADWLGSAMAIGLQYFPPAAVLASIMAFAALLTNFSSNAAAAAVGAPISLSLAQQLHIPPEPLVLAVLFGCNLCYATPFAYQTNILILSAGGYTFKDYVRAGLPLVLLMIVTLSILLVRKYGL
jgi:di/tricarboxylate transporter